MYRTSRLGYVRTQTQKRLRRVIKRSTQVDEGEGEREPNRPNDHDRPKHVVPGGALDSRRNLIDLASHPPTSRRSLTVVNITNIESSHTRRIYMHIKVILPIVTGGGYGGPCQRMKVQRTHIIIVGHSFQQGGYAATRSSVAVCPQQP